MPQRGKFRTLKLVDMRWEVAFVWHLGSLREGVASTEIGVGPGPCDFSCSPRAVYTTHAAKNPSQVLMEIFNVGFRRC